MATFTELRAPNTSASTSHNKHQQTPQGYAILDRSTDTTYDKYQQTPEGYRIFDRSTDTEYDKYQQILDGFEALHQTFTGVMVPTGAFTSVRVLCLDEEGEIINGTPLWVLPRERFPVAAPVHPDTHMANVWLLRLFRYDRFQLIVDVGRGRRLAWYEATEADIWSEDSEAILYFEEVIVASGLNASDTSLG